MYVGVVRRRFAAALFALALVAAACGGSGHHNHLERASGPSPTESTVAEPTTSTTVAAAAPTTGAAAATAPRATTAPRRPSTPAPAPGPAPATGPNLAAVRVRLTPVAGIANALAQAVRVNDSALYIATKTGQVRAIRGGQVDGTPVLDLSGQVSSGGEQGLLGLAFSPDGRHLYVNYTDTAGDTHVVEYPMNGGVASANSPRQLLFVKQPYANHNGGNLVFGPDGLLWIGLGDGGSSGDPNNNAQNLNTPLGKMLRMNVADGSYSIWAYGLRNPWRYSFDRATGSVWIGDVGQDMWEEVDSVPGIQPSWLDFGWSHFEGNHVYNASRNAPSAIPPVYEYSHNGGNCSVTGGYVYRGSRVPNMNGVYLFADFCVGHFFGLANGQVRDLGISTTSLSSFGQDASGELYVLSLSSGVFRVDPA